jgi:hypothetical protein
LLRDIVGIIDSGTKTQGLGSPLRGTATTEFPKTGRILSEINLDASKELELKA